MCKILTYIESMRPNQPLAVSLSALLLLPIAGAAATDGSMGTTSTGTLEISLTIPPEVRISGLQDLRLQQDARKRFRGSTALCVYARVVDGYQLIASSDDGQSEFVLAGASRLARYQVRFDDGSGPQPLTPDVPLRSLQANSASDPDCASAHGKSRLEVEVEPSQQLATGIYSGTLRLTVAPE